MSLSRGGALVATGLAAAVLVTACGSSSTGTAKAGGGAGGGTTSGGTVHFAASGALSGLQAAVGVPIIEGTKAAAEVINANGGILGKKLVIDQVDTKGDPADAVTAIRQDFALNKPAVMIGPASLEIHGAQPVFDQAKIPDGWNGGSAEFDMNKDPYLFRCNASDTQEGVAMAAYAVQKGYKHAAMYFTNIAASQAFEPIITQAFTKLGGTIVDTENVTPGLSSYRTEVSKVIAAKPDVIFSQMEPATAATTVKNFQQLGGLNVPVVATDLMAGSDVIKAVGPAFDAQHVVMLQGSNALTGSAAAFTAAYQKANGKAPEAGAGYAYDCTIDFALAITQAKSFDSASILKAMPQVSNPPGTAVNDYATAVKDIQAGMKINYEGISGPMDFNQYNNVNGPWDAVIATGDAAGDTKVLKTLTAQDITNALAGKV
jgi:branched-chain amino acid transport system substrate-binding protein